MEDVFGNGRAGHIRYQEDLITPGILPFNASSRNWMRDTPNLRLKPRGRPLMEQRLRMRTGEALRAMRCSFFWAAKNSSSVVAEFFEHGLRLGALLGVLLDQPDALLVAFDGGGFRHVRRRQAAGFGASGAAGSLRRKGMPRRRSSSRPSSSLSADVTMVMSSPMLFFTFSTVISGKMVKSEMPRL